MDTKNATSSVTPAACPCCGFAFDIAATDETKVAHFLAHMVVTMAPGMNRDTTADW